ncbi:MAG TPA: DUF1559 domain-containing protein, partial [Gemmataceae bacterium]
YAQYTRNPSSPGSDFTVKTYLSPADPTLSSLQHAPGLSSYAANAQVFFRDPNLARSFPDGTSNTVAFAEHYASCGRAQFNWYVTSPRDFGDYPFLHRTTFADNGPAIRWYYLNNNAFYDVYPVTGGNPPTSEGSVAGLTFQVRPKPQECDLRIPQTPHSGGMLVALCDGSVRTLAPNISSTTFWGAVTPTSGEILSDW